MLRQPSPAQIGAAEDATGGRDVDDRGRPIGHGEGNRLAAFRAEQTDSVVESVED